MKPLSIPPGAPILVRSPNWVGDAVMAMPFYDALAQLFPDSPITVAARPHAADIARLDRGVQVLEQDDRGRDSGVTGRLRLATELRRMRFKAVFLLPHSFSSALLPFLARIPIRVGYSRDARGLFLTHGVRWSAAARAMHRTDAYLHLLTAVGLQPARPPIARYEVRTEERREVAHLLAGAAVEGRERLIAVAPGAMGVARRWPAERFAGVGVRLAKRFDARLLLLGGPADRPLCDAVERAAGGLTVNLAGRTPLALLPALIDRCSLLVANDSGASHVASLTQTPTIVLQGAGDESITRQRGAHIHLIRKPMGCAPCVKNVCARGDQACLISIDVDDVLALAEYLLAPGQAPASGGQCEERRKKPSRA
ncbi:MAG: lipopolysaccharide heptosyltransferase II [Candidatus Riflebacteria bacterium]|nr:lipopolysaccharide heptosyltransferase II [Candidatus Riflebacteria bacterium]